MNGVRSTKNTGASLALCLFFVTALSLFSVSSSNAQNSTTGATDGSTPIGLSPGAPAGSYALNGFENVNLYNGHLNVHLPLVTIGGRGEAKVVSALSIDAQSWTVRHGETTNPYTGDPIDVYTPVPSPWVPKPGYGPGVLVGRQSGINPTQTCPGPSGGVIRYL